MKILSFTQIQVISNQYDFLSSAEHDMRQFEEYFNCFFSYNESQWGPELTFIVWGGGGLLLISQKSYRFEIKLCPVKEK